MGCDGCILDGELIVVDTDDGKMMPFGLNKTKAHNQEEANLQLCYRIFDILWVKSDDVEMSLLKITLRERKKLLSKVVQKEIQNRIELVTFK